jgi:hypothetical protein
MFRMFRVRTTITARMRCNRHDDDRPQAISRAARRAPRHAHASHPRRPPVPPRGLGVRGEVRRLAARGSQGSQSRAAACGLSRIAWFSPTLHSFVGTKSTIRVTPPPSVLASAAFQSSRGRQDGHSLIAVRFARACGSHVFRARGPQERDSRTPLTSQVVRARVTASVAVIADYHP